MGTPNLNLRVDGKYYYCQMSSEANKPRLCLQHDEATYYAPLSTTAEKPRLCLQHEGVTYYAPLSRKEFPKGLVVHLPFANSPTEDTCGNSWNNVGVVIQDDDNAISGKSAYFNGTSRESYIELADNTGFKLGGQDFTIDGWLNMDSATMSGGIIFQLKLSYGFMIFSRENSTDRLQLVIAGSPSSMTSLVGQRIHFAIVYQYAEKVVTFFINGTKVGSKSRTLQYARHAIEQFAIGGSANGKRLMTGTMEHFRVFDGIAKWTSDFTPPTAADYEVS